MRAPCVGQLVKTIHNELAKQDATLLDAPVSGGVEGAREGTLTILIGGSETHLQDVRPILDLLGSKLVHVGEVGSASICKVLHNCAVFCANLATVECLTTGVKAGVDAPENFLAYKDFDGIDHRDTAFRHVLLRWDLRKQDPDWTHDNKGTL